MNRTFTLPLFAALMLSLASCASTPDNDGITYGDGFIVFEAEATTNSISENWIIRREGNSGYNNIKSEIPTVSGTYIEYVGGVTTGIDIKPGEDILTYKFTPKQSGSYLLTGRMAQQLNQPEGMAANDHCNDVFIKMEGNFTSGNEETPLNVLQEWNKYYGRGYNEWGTFTRGDVNHIKYLMEYQLTAGEEYTLHISGRSKGLAIDYMLLSMLPIKVVDAEDIAVNSNPDMRPCGVENGRYSSITFDKFTGWDGDFVDASIDPWRNVLQIADRMKWGAAETTFKGKSGSYSITLNTILESDGESTFKVYIDNEMVGEVTNDKIFGANIDDYTPAAIKISDKKIKVQNGATIRVEFCSATNGMVPEGDVTATSRGRWQSILFE